MSTEYSEILVNEDDTETSILSTLAKGDPFVFIATEIMMNGDLNQRVVVGNGVRDTKTIRSVLNKTLAALPE